MYVAKSKNNHPNNVYMMRTSSHDLGAFINSKEDVSHPSVAEPSLI